MLQGSISALLGIGRDVGDMGASQIALRTILVYAFDIFGASTEQAMAHASAWLGSTRHDSPLTENE
jgi:hypothetical protein